MKTNFIHKFIIFFIIIKSVILQNNTNSTSKCNDYDEIGVCISKPNCCFVELTYSIFQETQCVDVFSSNNFQNFCGDIKNTTKRKNYRMENCQCFNYRYNSSKFLNLSIVFIIALLFTLF